MSVSTWGESDFAREFPGKPVWSGRVWTNASEDGKKKIAMVRCPGMDIVCVADVTGAAATNRACAFVLSCLQHDKGLLDRFLKARSCVLSAPHT